MSYIHFKSVYNKNYDKITFDAVSLSLGQLKKLIIEKSKFTKQLDFDLEITNADTNEVYRNEADMVMKNTRVHVKRIMKNSTMPLRAQPPKVTPPTQPVATTAAAEAAAAFSQLKPQMQPIQPPVTTIPTPNQSAPVIIPQKQMVTSVSTSQLQISSQPITQTTQPSMSHSASTSMLSNMPKSVYDSLAPLNLPSKPLNYGQESTAKLELELSQVNNSFLASNESSMTAKNTSEDSRQDEKLKLESILLSSMNSQQQGHMNPGQGLKSSQYSTNHTMHLASQTADLTGHQNRFPSGQWPPRMPIGQHRPLPANYRCAICKKPGHPKSLCPDAGSYVKPEERPKFPSGIPKGKMRPATAGDKFSMLGPDGYVVPIIDYQVSKVIKKDKPAFLTEEEEDEEKKRLGYDPNGPSVEASVLKYPPELKCPFGDHIIMDAVLVPCCGHFICCDECIRQKIYKDELVECPHEECDQEIGSLESITPYHNIRRMVNDFLNEVKRAKEPANTKSSLNSDPFLDSLLDDVQDIKSSKEAAKSPSKIDYDDLFCNKTETKDDFALIKVEPADQVVSGTESPKSDGQVSSSVAKLQASLTENFIKQKSPEDIKDSLPHQQPALLPTPHVLNDLRGTPPVSISPPVNLTRPMMSNQYGSGMPNQVLAQQQSFNPVRMMGQPQQLQSGFIQQFPNQQLRPPLGMAQGLPVPMQQQMYQKPQIQSQSQIQHPMMMQQGYPPHTQQQQQQQQQSMQFMASQNQMLGLPHQQAMMNRQMGGSFNQNMPPHPHRFPMQPQKPMYPVNQYQQSGYQMGPHIQQHQPGFVPNLVPGMPMQPFPTGPSAMTNIPMNQLYNNQPVVAKPPISGIPPVNTALMSEAEFYSYKKQLEAETTRANNEKYRRQHRSRSRSYSRSDSRSYSGSPRRRNRSRNRSYSYSRSRSRSSSRSDRDRRYKKTSRKSRSRSPRYYSSRNYSQRGGYYDRRGTSKSKSSVHRSSDYRRRSRSRSKASSKPAIETQHYQEQKLRQHEGKSSRSKSPDKNQTSNDNAGRTKLEKIDETNGEKKHSSKNSKSKIEMSNYDQTVHKLMNKIRKVKSPEVFTEQPLVGPSIEPTQAADTTADKSSKDRSSKEKSDKKHRDKKSSKYDKEANVYVKCAEKRSNSLVMETVDENGLSVVSKEAVKESDSESSKKKKHKKSEKNSELDEGKEKHKKHKKSKKHKKNKSVSKERECEAPGEVLITQVPQIAF